MIDFLQEMLFSLKNNKLRTFLTASSVFWGAFILIVLIGLGKGFQNGVYDIFESDIHDHILIEASTATLSYKGTMPDQAISLSSVDIELIKNRVPEVAYAETEVSRHATTKYENKSGDYPIFGISPGFFKIKDNFLLEKGRFFNSADYLDSRNVVLIGTSVSKRLFNDKDAVGRRIDVDGTFYIVIGLFYDRTNRGQDSERLYIPSSTYQSIYSSSGKVDRIWLRPESNSDTYNVEARVVALLKNYHSVSPHDVSAIKSFNIAESVGKINALFAGINAFLWFVGLGTLFAGIVGVSNIMVIIVNERKYEIGVRKALGAVPSTIINGLLMEAIIITSVSGCAGLLAGIGLIRLLSFTLHFFEISLPYFKNPGVDLKMAASAITILIIAGALAGLIPSLRASRIPPIEAMRYE